MATVVENSVMASTNLWLECLGWLRRCGVALPDHIPSTRNLECFSHYLRDGVVLCHLIHLLNPSSLDFFFDVSELSSMDPDENEDLCLQNIEAFLEICQMDFGLARRDLFEPAMLYHLDDFDRVLYTLSQLSKSPRVARLGIMGFPVPHVSGSDDQTTGDQTGQNSFVRPISTIYDPANEVIYMSILSNNFQRSTSLTTATMPTDPVERTVQKMCNVERDYIMVLTIMEEMMVGPLSKILTTQEQSTIFYGIKELNQIHQQIHRELLSVISSKVKQPLTKLYIVFLNWKDKLHIYQRYAANLPLALHVVGRVYRAKKNLAKEVELAQGNLRDHFKLTNLLLQPIQHLSQYVVLFGELNKYIPENHEDYHGIKIAGHCMSELVEDVNAIKKDSFILQTLKHAQSKIDCWKPTKSILSEFGRFFRNGSLKVSFSTAINSHEKTKYQVFLFSRMVVFCTPKSKMRGLRTISRNQQFTYHSHLLLQNYAVEELVGLAGFFEASTTPWTSCWRVKGPTGKTSVIFYSKTHEERRKWIESFKVVMDRLHPSLDNTDAKTHTFVLQTFSSKAICHVCHKLLKGLLDQGYRCGKCSQSFHKKCLELSQTCEFGAEEIYANADSEHESGIYECTSLNTSARSSYWSEASSYQSEGVLSPPVSFAFQLYETPVQQVKDMDQSDDGLESQLWYGGSISAQEATAYLAGSDPGTFLVRKRDPKSQDALSAPFAISVVMNTGVKHIKIQHFKTEPEENEYIALGLSWSKHEFFLVPGNTFPTINDLVCWYSHNFLSEEVTRVMDVYLKAPFRVDPNSMQYTSL
ncbi:proto-oncogene vav-like isoform X2 [Daphnia carinata]|uniref:proto-oncogene vav-like isoform X2 n=1 Tax=Daphnia carinata TaxID=120202 RepID=UPI0028684ECF|nr:proto-oncogene vav-like isoform X2 [Daphnia carinata]